MQSECVCVREWFSEHKAQVRDLFESKQIDYVTDARQHTKKHKSDRLSFSLSVQPVVIDSK